MRFEDIYFSGHSYLLENRYPVFQVLANSIKNYFCPERILDAGCAKGFLVKAFNEIGVEAWGVDVSEYALSSAPEDIKHRLYKINLNYDRLPFNEGYFDFITFIGTIQYLTNHRHAISEVKRVLRDGGRVYLADTRIKKSTNEKVEGMNNREHWIEDGTDNKEFWIKESTNNKRYWIKEFESHGFRFNKKELEEFTINGLLYQMFETQNKNTIKFKIGKKIFQKGGSIGKRIVFLIHKISNLNHDKNYGEFLFIKCRNENQLNSITNNL